jgi:hypothetical protein
VVYDSPSYEAYRFKIMSTLINVRGCNMFTGFKKASFVLSTVGLLAFTGVPLTALAAPGQGVPFQDLQAQIDALRDTVAELSQQLGGGDKEELVECGNGATIADALAGASAARHVTITITGQCNETVNLTRDDVTLLGGSGTITGPVALNGARRIVIDGLTLLGGVAATRGATVLIQDSTIDVGGNVAILVNHGSFAEIFNNPLIRSQENCAVQASDGGEVRMQGNLMVQSNQSSNGICSTLGLFRRGLARLRGGNTFVNDVGGDVLTLVDGSVIRQDGGFDSFQGNAFIGRTSNAEIRNAQFDANRLTVSQNSSARFRSSVVNVTEQLEVFTMSAVEATNNSIVNGFISVTENSNLLVRFGSTVNGDMFIGERSQAFLNFAEVNGNIACNTSGSPSIPGLALQLLTSPVFPPPPGTLVFTSAGQIAFAYRGAVVGTPTGNVTFNPTCN